MDVCPRGHVVIVDLAVVSGASAAALLVVHAVTFAIGRRIGRYNVVDVAWGLGFIAVAAVAAILGDGDAFRRRLLLALVTIWGLRLSWYIYRRSAGKGEDPRYADLLRGATVGQVVRKVFVVQAFATWFISLPLQLSAVIGPTPRPWLAVTAAGVLLWVTGVVFEAVGDHQLRVFKSDPAHQGVVMDRGLWAWTRHPNYFGDACVWWGLWLISIAGWWSLMTVLSPLLMTYFLVYVTGARLTEKYMAGRPGFDEYKARTPFFVPRPPRRTPRSAQNDDRRR
jgi:steroid 5-alpha reductase family enzyme